MVLSVMEGVRHIFLVVSYELEGIYSHVITKNKSLYMVYFRLLNMLSNTFPNYLEEDFPAHTLDFTIHHFTTGDISAIAGTDSLRQIMDGHFLLDKPTIIAPLTRADYSHRISSQVYAPDLSVRVADLLQAPLFAFVDTTRPVGVSEYALLTFNNDLNDLQYRVLASELRESGNSHKVVRRDLRYTKIEPESYLDDLLQRHTPDIVYALDDDINIRRIENTWKQVHARDRYLRDV